MRKQVHRYLQGKAFKIIQLESKLSSGIQISIKNRMEWIIYNDIFVEGDYDAAILDILETSDSSINVLDLGANVGFFDLRLVHLAYIKNSAKRFTVKAVDGSEALCDEFRQRIYLSKVNSEFQIDILHGLIGAKSGKGLLYQFNQHGLNSTSRPHGNPVETSYINLTEVCNSFQEIHLLKCDIEGSELSFIQTYPDLLQKTRALVVEFHPEFCNPEHCIQHIKEIGFNESGPRKDYGNCFIQYFRKAPAHNYKKV